MLKVDVGLREGEVPAERSLWGLKQWPLPALLTTPFAEPHGVPHRAIVKR